MKSVYKVKNVSNYLDVLHIMGINVKMLIENSCHIGEATNRKKKNECELVALKSGYCLSNY